MTIYGTPEALVEERTCPRCKGSGWKNNDPIVEIADLARLDSVRCPRCKGLRAVYRDLRGCATIGDTNDAPD